MPRISRSNRNQIGKPSVSFDGKHLVALYIRLSREDGDKLESDSIVNQRNKLRNFIEGKEEFVFHDTYVDDGFTGTNFDRQDFKRMISDIENRTVNCVIVKDLSRFGRDYIGVGEYLEKIFPQNNVRFIAIDDNIDSSKNVYDMMMPVRNVFNEQYAADISKKVKSAFKTKQLNGEFIGAFAPYGYKKDPHNKNKLVIDTYAADIVKRVFDMYLSGKGKIAIAKQLNSESIPCPSAYKSLNGLNYTNGQNINDTKYWTYATIHRMLKHEVYIGNTVQGTNYRMNIKVKAKMLPREQWITVKNTHEPIIDKQTWNAVQNLLQRDTRQIDFNQNISVFAGFLCCGDCGRAMAKNSYTKKNGEKSISYRCGSYQRYGSDVCTTHTIRHEVLEKVILDDINSMIINLKAFKRIVENSVKSSEKKRVSSEQEINRISVMLEKTKRLKKGLYEDYKEGLLLLDEYKSLKERYDEEEQLYANMVASLSQNDDISDSDAIAQEWVVHLLERGSIEELDRVMLSELVDEIHVFEDSKIKIIYRIEVRDLKESISAI